MIINAINSKLDLEKIKLNVDIFTKYLVVGLGVAISTSTAVTNILSITILILALFLHGKEIINSFTKNKVYLSILVFLLFSLFSASYSVADSKDILHTFLKYSKLLYIPIIATLIKEQEWKVKAIAAFLVGLLINLLIIYLKCFDLAPIWLKSLTHTSIEVAFKDRIFTGLFFAFGIFICLNFCFYNYLKMKNYNLYRIYCFIFIIVSFPYLLIFNTGRVGHIIFIGLFLFFLCNSLKEKEINYKYILLLFFIIVLCSPFLHSNLIHTNFYKRAVNAFETGIAYFEAEKGNLSKDKFDPYDTSIAKRLDFYRNTAQLIKEKPLLGYGLGSFSNIYNDRFIRNKTTNPHNQYLYVGMESGVIGLAIFIFIFIFLFVYSNKLIAIERFLLQGALFSFALGNLFNSWLVDFSSIFFFTFFVGVLLGRNDYY